MNKMLFGVLAFLLTLYAMTGLASASSLYSVDVDTDELVRIDSTTGSVTVIGSLGRNAGDIDLTRTDNGQLYGLNSVLGSDVELWTIDLTTGAVSTAIQLNGIIYAEGLGHSGNNLKIGYSSGSNYSFSDLFADLSTAGIISNSMSYTVSNTGSLLDFDGISVGLDNIPFYAVDVFHPPSSNETKLFTVDPVAVIATAIGTYSGTPSVFANDLVVDGAQLFMIDHNNDLLYRVDPNTGILDASISLNRQGSYFGLAVADPDLQPPVADPNGPYSALVDELILFDGSASYDPDGTIASYQWNFGDGSSGIGPTPTKAYATAGTYIVTLTVTDNDGLTSTAETTTTISDVPLEAPIADAGGPYAGNADLPINFDASGSSDPDGIIETYTWNFGDGSPEVTVVTATVQHTYDLDGSYTATLTVTDNDGLTGTDEAPVTIGEGNPPPTAVAGGPYTGEPGVPVTLDGSGSSDSGSGTIESWDWDFGDGTTGSGETVDHIYAAEGLYNVTLTVTDNGGKVDSDFTTATIAVPQAPVADANGPYSGLVGELLTFDGTASSDADGIVVAWDWAFGDGSTGTGATPTHAYGAAGSYTVTLVVTDDDGLTSTPATTTAEILEEKFDPIADPNGPYTGTEGRELTFDGTGSYDPDGGVIATYDWDFGDGNSGIGPTPTHIYAIAGIYTVNLAVTDDEGVTSATVETTTEIGVDAPPVANPDGPYAGTVDIPVTFDGSGSTDDFQIVSYDWDFGDVNDPTPGTGIAPEHTYTETGVYTVTLTVTDDAGQSDTATTEATIGEGNLPPVADADGPYSGEVGEVISFDGTGSTDPNGEDTIVSYDWDFGDGIVLLDAGPTPTHAYNESGLYHVTLTVTDDFGAMDSDKTKAEIVEVGTEADVYLTHLRAPRGLSLGKEDEACRTVLVMGDGDMIKQDATVTLWAEAPDGLEVEIEPQSRTETVYPGGTPTRFPFEVEVECEHAGRYEIQWTATIDAEENADPTNDTVVATTVVRCRKHYRNNREH